MLETRQARGAVVNTANDVDRRRIGPVPAMVDPDAPFTLIDAWPSFERTPTDNVWRGSGND